MHKGESETLTATVKPENAEDKTVTWSSSDITCVSVDNTGKVTAIAIGKATRHSRSRSKIGDLPDNSNGNSRRVGYVGQGNP
ncbi:MAG: Ig-like domain-containing protein [Alistipes onderdonkii]